VLNHAPEKLQSQSRKNKKEKCNFTKQKDNCFTRSSKIIEENRRGIIYQRNSRIEWKLIRLKKETGD
jgi:hypothetical protein